MTRIHWIKLKDERKLVVGDVWSNNDPNVVRETPCLMQTVPKSAIGCEAGYVNNPLDIDVYTEDTALARWPAEDTRPVGWYRPIIIDMEDEKAVPANRTNERKIDLNL